MSEPTRMDRVFDIIIKRMVKTVQAPHYTEIAAELGVSVEEGRKALHELKNNAVFQPQNTLVTVNFRLCRRIHCC